MRCVALPGWPLIGALLLVAACATTPPPSGRPGASKPATPAKRGSVARSTADGAAVPGGRRHIVKEGDTGLAIARAYGVPWARIASANGLDREAVIRVGQTLFIPTGQNTAQKQAATSGQPKPSTSRPVAPSAPVPNLAWPVDGRVILSGFGPKPGGRVNDGINIKALPGAPVRAAADGEVIYTGSAIQGFGLLILLRHADGFVTAYGHLEDALVKRGDKVKQGQPIARAGSSGEAREPQLLFQLRQGRQALNPLPYLPK